MPPPVPLENSALAGEALIHFVFRRQPILELVAGGEAAAFGPAVGGHGDGAPAVLGNVRHNVHRQIPDEIAGNHPLLRIVNMRVGAPGPNGCVLLGRARLASLMFMKTSAQWVSMTRTI